MSSRTKRIILFVLAVISATPAAAQVAQSSSADQPVTDLAEMVDVADLIRMLRNQPPPEVVEIDYRKAMRAFAPVIGAKPSSGAIFGVAGNIGFYRGEPATTRISSSVASVTISSKKQAGINAHTMMFGNDDRWLLELDDRFQWTSQETFGLGTNTASAAGEEVRFDFYRLYQTAYLRLRGNLFAGGGLYFDNHADVHPDEDEVESWPQSAYYQYSVANGLPLDGQSSAGPSVEILWDSRDSFINPSRGWLARVNYRTLVDGFLGGDSSWEKVNLDLRAYAPLTPDRRHKLAVWAFADLVVDGVAPYFDLPSTAGDSYRPFGPRLRRRALPGREAGVCRAGVSGAVDAQRVAGHDGVREHDDDLQSSGRRTALRQVRARRRRRPAPAAEQAVPDQPGVRRGVRRKRKQRRVSDGAGSVLTGTGTRRATLSGSPREPN